MKDIKSRQKKRRTKTREERKLILLGVEGKNRSEFLYFKNFNSLQKRYRIKIVLGNNTHLQGIINEMKTHIKNSGLSDGDLLYCLFDMDFDKNKMKSKKILKIIIFIISIILIFVPTIVMLSNNFYASIIDVLQDFLVSLPFTLLGMIGASITLKKLLED